MKRVEIVARGDVPRVGFRDLVQKMGRDLGLSGTVERQYMMIERQDETIGEIRGMRSDLQDHMDRRFSKIEGEIAEIKAAIAEMKGES
jgi:hydrogenase maturation factor HypF (carbamoyltransferase family)